MKIVILTSSLTGVAAHAVPLLFAEPAISIEMVIFNEGQPPGKKKYYLKKIKKTLKIGIMGTLNGIRMRNWFGKNAEKFLPAVNLETYCKQNNIQFYKTPAINSEITKELFSKASADIGISLGNSFISKSIFNIPRLGMINIHGEVLPQYQNAQSVIWQLYNGSTETGLTIHKINRKIDQGDILYTEKFPIKFLSDLKSTVAYNCAEITKRACAALVKVVNNFSYYDQHAIPQKECTHYTTPTIKEFKKIKQQFILLKNNAAL